MTPLQELTGYLARKKPNDIAILIDSISEHRTMSIEELTGSEINLLLTVFRPKTIEEKANVLVNELKLKTMRSNVLALAERTGIKEAGNFHTFNKWMMISSVFKKHLNAHSLEELQVLYKQLRGVEMNNNRSAQKPMTKAWFQRAEKIKTWN